MTTTAPVDLWRDHQARYEILYDALNRGFEKSGRELTPLEKHSVETFVSILTDYAAELMNNRPTVEEWIGTTTEYLVSNWPVLPLFLAAINLESIVLQDVRPDGLAGQALQEVIDRWTPIAENQEPEVYK